MTPQMATYRRPNKLDRLTSRPLTGLIRDLHFAQVAQSVEQGIENPRVGGSIPSLGTIYRRVYAFTHPDHSLRFISKGTQAFSQRQVRDGAENATLRS